MCRGNVTQNVVQSIAPFVEQNFIIKELPPHGTSCDQFPQWQTLVFEHQVEYFTTRFFGSLSQHIAGDKLRYFFDPFPQVHRIYHGRT
jgi:hypothetical protein